jgi:hypothetical protein
MSPQMAIQVGDVIEGAAAVRALVAVGSVVDPEVLPEVRPLVERLRAEVAPEWTLALVDALLVIRQLTLAAIFHKSKLE